MQNNDLYIEQILKKLENINDEELITLVKRLINERNYLTKIANIDTLTGLNNRRIVSRIRECSAVVMCDIDNFKNVNDTYGHDVGDEVIKTVTETIKNNTRSIDYVCRYGGDEFFIAFVNCPEDIIGLALERIKCELSEKFILPDSNKKITVSFGFAVRDDSETVDDLIKKADTALYESKRNGKDTITKYNSKQKTKIKK